MSEDIKPRYNVGEQVTVSRGKLTGKVGTVIEVDEAKKEYAIRIPDFGLRVVSFSAVKPKTEPTINAAGLAAVLNPHVGQYPDSILADFEAVAPGITADVRLATVEA
jgi:hypothetical protein